MIFIGWWRRVGPGCGRRQPRAQGAAEPAGPHCRAVVPERKRWVVCLDAAHDGLVDSSWGLSSMPVDADRGTLADVESALLVASEDLTQRVGVTDNERLVSLPVPPAVHPCLAAASGGGLAYQPPRSVVELREPPASPLRPGAVRYSKRFSKRYSAHCSDESEDEDGKTQDQGRCLDGSRRR